MLEGKSIIRTGEGTITAGDRIIQAGEISMRQDATSSSFD